VPYGGAGYPQAAYSATPSYPAAATSYPGAAPSYATTASTPAYAGQNWTSVPTDPAQPGLPGQPGEPGQPNGPAKTGAWRKVAVATVAAAALAVTAGGVGGFVGYELHPDDSPVQNTATQPRNAAPAVDRSSLATTAATVQPTVVSVKTRVGEGSGVVISADGYIVTNNHVVEGASGSAVQVTFNSGKQLDATIVGTDPKTDLAVIKVGATGLTFVNWGNSDDVQVGDTVLAIGSPLGLQGSVTAGIVSALHRTITVGGDQQSQFSTPTATTTIGDALQTDAPINPGNSGGALVDTTGKLIGINSAIATSGSNGNIGVGFAIPSNRVKTVSEQLMKGGKVSHPYLGVSVGAAQNGGAQIQTVEAGSPADKAGIVAGDVVTKVGDRAITTSEDLVGAIQSSSAGTQMKLTVVRNGTERQVTATVGEQP
jgi:putative serine protease PepD